jgi:hypothetical protein
MLIPVGKLALTVMVIEFEVAGFPDVQLAFEVSLHTTTSPLTGI